MSLTMYTFDKLFFFSYLLFVLTFCTKLFSSPSTHMIRVRTTSKGVHTVSDINAAREPHTHAANPLTEIPGKR
jgi:hypothetical protein